MVSWGSGRSSRLPGQLSHANLGNNSNSSTSPTSGGRQQQQQPRPQPNPHRLAIGVISVFALIVFSQLLACGAQSDGNESTHANKSNRSQYNGGAAGFMLLAEPPSQSQLDTSQPIDSILEQTLDKIGPDMKPTSDFRDPANITLEISQRAWQLMHEHALKATRERIDFIWPTVERILSDSNVSSNCLIANQRLASAVSRLESWSVQLLNSWGSFPPSGLFEGTYGDIGSFHGCINVPENPAIKHAHYCTIAYKPVMPTRRDYELIIRKEPIGMLQLFDKISSSGTNNQTNNNNKNALTDLINQAQYSHYIYYKIGTCFPIECTPIDVQKIARYLGRRSILISGPVKCSSKFSQDYEQLTVEHNVDNVSIRKKLVLSSQDLNNGIYIWKPHMTKAQLISLAVISSLFGLIISITLVDMICNYIMPALVQINLPKSSSSIDKPIREQQQQQYQQEQNVNLEMKQVMNAINGSSTSKHMVADSNNIPIDMIQKKQQTNNITTTTTTTTTATSQQSSIFMQIINDCSLITSTKEFLLINNSASQQKNDILCINGLRCITMSWIIVAHTMQYNDWSAFARTHEIETHLRSLINQPLFNASYLVDTFFLISGLLTSFSAFRVSKNSGGCHRQNLSSPPLLINANNNNTIQRIGNRNEREIHPSIKPIMTKFSCSSYLIGRYLRLTPQILLVSLLFILLPLLNPTGSPHWYTMTGEYSENCSKNWWINLIHIQAFYKSNEMCNFVCWWISVDMFYHLFALFIILSLLKYGCKISFRFYSIAMLCLGIWQASQHYQMNLPPNLLSTIPQTGAMWSQMTLDYFWRPISHTFPFLFGFYMGYSMAQHELELRNWFNPKRALIGWSVAISMLFSVSYGTYFWVIGVWSYTNTTATLFNLVSQIIWSLCLAWIIVACHFDYGGIIQSILSCKLFIILGKASYIVYLSHFLVLFAFFGSQNHLLEPTQVLMLYVILGNVCLSMLFGSLLCITFELPWFKLQRRIMRKMR